MKEEDINIDKQNNKLQIEKSDDEGGLLLKINKSKEKNGKIDATPTIYFYLLLISIVFIIILFLFLYIHYGRYRIEMLVSEKEMIKPLVDDRKYRVIKLTNNLEVLMISDINSGRCSASMSVGVGSFQDDEDILGLAHFTEHMIFLGSKSYPKPGEFEDHLSNYFGITNAFTEDEKTTFFYEIGCRGFQKSLVMFSRMFAEPLFDINYMAKEINAVNSENDKNLNQDPWREHQLLKHLSNPKHPFNRFNTGNNNTLNNLDSETLNKRLNTFYNKYYTPNNMRLVVLSNQSLESMQNNIAQYYSDIRLDSLQKDSTLKYGEIRTKEKAYSSKELGKLVWFSKLSPSPNLDIVFVIDEILSHYQFKPMDYISYLLKYSGEGSLIKYLKDQKFATKVDVGIIATFKNFSQFAISISLTGEGLNKVISVLDSVFDYINLIRNNKINIKTYDEIHNLTKTQFKFLEKNEKYGDYLAQLANTMFDYSYREILYGEYLHSNFNETLIKNYVDMIAPENSLVIIGSNKYPPDNYLLNSVFKNSKNETEIWYNTPFMQAKLNDEMLKILGSEKSKNDMRFKLKPINEFITEENNIVSCLDDNNHFMNTKDVCRNEMRNFTPTLILNETNFKVWYKMDRSFLVPRIVIDFNLISDMLRTNQKDYLVFYIFFNYLNSNFESTFSDLIETGNELKVSYDENGLVLSLTLFSDLAEKVLDKLFSVIFKPQIDEANFNQLYLMALDNLKSQAEGQPYEKSREIFKKISKYNVTGYLDMIKEEENLKEKLTFLHFNKILHKIINTLGINSLFYGNLQRNKLDKITKKIKGLLNENKAKNHVNYSTTNLINLLHSQKIIESPVIFRIKNDLKTENNHLVQNYFQVGYRDFKKSLTMNIIEMIWGNMFFYYLRTLKQLGYIVSANKEIIDNHMYFVFVVQGNKKNPSEMNLEIDNILWRLRDKIIALPDAKFKEVVASIKNELYKKDTNLKERSRKIWIEIFENNLDFNRKEKLLEEINKISKQDILEAFDNIFIDKPQKLSIQIYSPDSEIEKNVEEVYYLNANVKYKVTSDVNVLSEVKTENSNDDED